MTGLETLGKFFRRQRSFVYDLIIVAFVLIFYFIPSQLIPRDLN
jgi:hypothetical protein